MVDERIEGFLASWGACPDPACAIAEGGRILAANPAWEERLGRPAAELLGRSIVDIVSPGDRAKVADQMSTLDAGGRAVTFAARCGTASGSTQPLSFRAWRTEEGAVLVGTAQGAGDGARGEDEDEERRHLRRELRRLEQRFTLHFEQAPVGMVEWDSGFRIIDWNPTAARIFGYSREEAIGKHGSALLVPEGGRRHMSKLWNEVVSGKNDLLSVNENVTKDGRVILCEWRNTSLIDDNGELVGVASLVTDVTDRYTAEEERREREESQAATIAQLSAPVIDVWEGILAMPLIGDIDEARSARMTESLLEAIVQGGASFTIVDLTGSTVMNTAIAAHLTRMVRAAGLLGTTCFVSGLSPAMARALVELDTDLGVRTFGTLRAALRHAIEASRARCGLPPRTVTQK